MIITEAVRVFKNWLRPPEALTGARDCVNLKNEKFEARFIKMGSLGSSPFPVGLITFYP
jgi:hypothetical protein